MKNQEIFSFYPDSPETHSIRRVKIEDLNDRLASMDKRTKACFQLSAMAGIQNFPGLDDEKQAFFLKISKMIQEQQQAPEQVITADSNDATPSEIKQDEPAHDIPDVKYAWGGVPYDNDFEEIDDERVKGLPDDAYVSDGVAYDKSGVVLRDLRFEVKSDKSASFTPTSSFASAPTSSVPPAPPLPPSPPISPPLYSYVQPSKVKNIVDTISQGNASPEQQEQRKQRQEQPKQVERPKEYKSCKERLDGLLKENKESCAYKQLAEQLDRAKKPATINKIKIELDSLGKLDGIIADMTGGIASRRSIFRSNPDKKIEAFRKAFNNLSLDDKMRLIEDPKLLDPKNKTSFTEFDGNLKKFFDEMQNLRGTGSGKSFTQFKNDLHDLKSAHKQKEEQSELEEAYRSAPLGPGRS